MSRKKPFTGRDAVNNTPDPDLLTIVEEVLLAVEPDQLSPDSVLLRLAEMVRQRKVGNVDEALTDELALAHEDLQLTLTGLLKRVNPTGRLGEQISSINAEQAAALAERYIQRFVMGHKGGPVI